MTSLIARWGKFVDRLLDRSDANAQPFVLELQDITRNARRAAVDEADERRRWWAGNDFQELADGGRLRGDEER